MIAELKRKSVSAVGWSAMEVFCRQGIQFFISIALARLLSPEQFGVVAMLFLFTALATSFMDAGFSAALIQKQDLTEDETSAVFYFNLAAGLAAALVLCAAAPWIARFFGLPVLQPLACVMALNLFLGAFGAVHQALLTKALDFRTQTRISVAATVISGGSAIYLAWRGAGVWSLVVQSLISTVITTSLLWWWRPWRPRLRARLAALRSLFRFGSYIFYSGLLNTAYTRLYTALIGKMYSPADLGQYARADSTQQLPASLLTTVVSRVAYPIFSSVSHDRDLLRRGLRRAMAQVMLVNLPVSLGLLAVARPLVLTLFGTAWMPSVPFLQVLCLGGVLWPLHVLNLSCLMAMGRSDLFFRLELWKKGLGIAAILVSANISVLAMAWAQVLMAVVSFFLNAHYTGRLLGYRPLQQLGDIVPAFLVAVVMLGCVRAVGWLPVRPAPVQLALQVLAGAAVYGTVCEFTNIPAFRELRQQLAAQLLGRRAPTPQTPSA